MTVSTAPYYKWDQRTDWNSPPYEQCSPNLVQLYAYCHDRWDAQSLGCHNDRPIRNDKPPLTMSTHAWGAAADITWHYPHGLAGTKVNRRALMEAEVFPFLIGESQELGINSIHDYAQKRIWYPSRGWHPASIQTGDWLHIEVLPEAWGDGRTVIERTVSELTDDDKRWISEQIVKAVAAVPAGVWAYKLNHPTEGAKDAPASSFMYYLLRNVGALYTGDAPPKAPPPAA